MSDKESKEHVFPEVHKPLLLEIFTKRPRAPRWVIATELARGGSIAKDTALEYINCAIKEGLIEKVGMDIRLKR